MDNNIIAQINELAADLGPGPLFREVDGGYQMDPEALALLRANADLVERLKQVRG